MSEDFRQRWVTVCEMLYGQPEMYYIAEVASQEIKPFNTENYYVLISGLRCGVYRTEFGIDAFSYSDCFREVEREINGLLAKQNVSCNTMMLLYDQSKRFAMIFSTPENISAGDVAEIVSSCFNRLYARIFDMSKTPYRNYTVLSEEIHGYDNLTKAFKKIDALSRQQYFDMRTMVMTPSLLEQVRVPADSEQIHEDLTQMYVAMRAGERQEMLSRFHVIMGQMEAARDFELLTDVLFSIRRTMEGMLRSHADEPDEAFREVFVIDNYPTFQLHRDAIEQYLIRCLEHFSDSRPMSRPIQEAVRYIRHHFAEYVSLANVAQHIGMSESWLTRQFKQECGCSIIQYLLDIRIERAKAFLIETDMQIQEISAAVGFENSGYFISVFRRVVGMTPKAFREKADRRDEKE